MKKIVINLSPQKENVTSAFLQNLISYTPLVGLSAAAIFALVLLVQLFSLKKAHTVRVYTKKWSQWESKANSIAEMKKELMRYESEKAVLQELVTPQNDMTFILRDLFSSLPKNIWFEKIRYEEGFINLAGYVVRWEEDSVASLDKFINSLRKKDYFSSKFDKINIKESKTSEFNSVEVLEFVIECKK